ncbi:MAG: AzlD domain-containing protein [Candidatus Heimdallarchaeota archaeon]|nr:AzlD domain-containing protein [Candidatus Heimdallarchaeota archaeon]
MYDHFELLIMFFLLGISTFGMRSLFLVHFPQKLNNEQIRKGLESVPSSLLVALVIPYTFFIETDVDFIRLEVFVLLVVMVIIKFLKTPGLSLVIALSLLLLFEGLLK